jgi:aspartate racemase
MKQKPIGILGGMGPGAGVYFKQLIVSMTPGKCDQDHILTVLYTNPCIPDRSKAIKEGTRGEFIDAVCESLKKLEQFEVSEIFIPCNTSFVGYEAFQESVSVPIYNLPRETMRRLGTGSVEKVLLLATQGTYDVGVYESTENTGVIYPVPALQELTHSLIIAVKSKDVIAQNAIFEELVKSLPNSLKTIILGCTELSMLATQFRVALPEIQFIDPLEFAAEYIIQKYSPNLENRGTSIIEKPSTELVNI